MTSLIGTLKYFRNKKLQFLITFNVTTGVRQLGFKQSARMDFFEKMIKWHEAK